MLKSELMLSHLAQDRANVEMDVTGVGNLQALVNRFIAVVKVVVLNF